MSNPEMLHPRPGTASGGAQDGVIVDRLRRDGYAFVGQPGMRPLLDAAGSADWDGYARSWDDLGPDRFMADGGTYRKRRFACFSAGNGSFRLKPPQAHFQTRDNNPLNGGVARVFEPVRGAIALHPVNQAIMATCLDLFAAATPPGVRPSTWHAEMHQFRIEARPEAWGKPSPEGLHRDGVDWVLVLMIRRENVGGGVSTIADGDRRTLCQATLSNPLDASLLDDSRVFHGVSPILPIDPSRPAWRDVLVMTFRREPGPAAARETRGGTAIGAAGAGAAGEP